MKHLKYSVWWKKTDDEISPVFGQLLWTLKFISTTSQGKLFFVLFQAFKKCKKNITVNYLVQGLCWLNLEIAWFPIRFHCYYSGSVYNTHNWMAWFKTGVTDFSGKIFLSSKVPEFLQVLFNLVGNHSFFGWNALVPLCNAFIVHASIFLRSKVQTSRKKYKGMF